MYQYVPVIPILYHHKRFLYLLWHYIVFCWLIHSNWLSSNRNNIHQKIHEKLNERKEYITQQWIWRILTCWYILTQTSFYLFWSFHTLLCTRRYQAVHLNPVHLNKTVQGSVRPSNYLVLSWSGIQDSRVPPCTTWYQKVRYLAIWHREEYEQVHSSTWWYQVTVVWEWHIWYVLVHTNMY